MYLEQNDEGDIVGEKKGDVSGVYIGVDALQKPDYATVLVQGGGGQVIRGVKDGLVEASLIVNIDPSAFRATPPVSEVTLAFDNVAALRGGELGYLVNIEAGDDKLKAEVGQNKIVLSGVKPTDAKKPVSMTVKIQLANVGLDEKMGVKITSKLDGKKDEEIGKALSISFEGTEPAAPKSTPAKAKPKTPATQGS